MRILITWVFSWIGNYLAQELKHSHSIYGISRHDPHMLSKDCRCIFIWSIAGKKRMKYGAVYQASKFWLRGFVWALAHEYPHYSFHLLNPRYVKTNFHKNSKIPINKELYQETKLEDIKKTIDGILLWDEKRLEIDL